MSDALKWNHRNFRKALEDFFSVRVVVRLYQKWTMAAATTSHALVAVSFAGFV